MDVGQDGRGEYEQRNLDRRTSFGDTRSLVSGNPQKLTRIIQLRFLAMVEKVAELAIYCNQVTTPSSSEILYPVTDGSRCRYPQSCTGLSSGSLAEERGEGLY